MPEFIVIGAGISGLTVAHKLARAGKDVIVLESSENVGGKILTERIDGYLLEAGPNSLRVENQETVDLIEECGLSSRVIEASPNSKKRFILKNGNWVNIPTGPIEALSTSLFSLGGKLRVPLDLFIPKTALKDESAASFITRRLGKEVFDYAADPFITGIYAGDPQKLCMRHAFPSMWNAEQKYGSLIRGMMKGRKGQSKDGIKSRIISFPDGLSELTNAIESNHAERIQLHDGALQIEETPNGFRVASSSGKMDASEIIVALPAYNAASMIYPLAPDLSRELLRIDYPPVAVVYLGYREDQFSIKPEGFGGLIPSKENRNILGIIFSSSNFPDRAPEGHLLLTVIMGGARNAEIIEQPVEKILSTAITEVNDLLKPSGAPTFQHVRVWKQAIPQYNMGYGAVFEEIDRTEQQNPGLHFIGNYRGGISMGVCIKNATELAKKLV
jgi:oxygen-dependent protoporphyrinogen oxidase